MTARTPIALQPETLLALHGAYPERYPVLLQSAARAEPLGRFDILLAFPGAKLALDGEGRLENSSDANSATSFLDTLDAWWRRERIIDETHDLPFVGGWFLFLAYELANEIEPTLRLPRAPLVAQAIRIQAAIIQRCSDGAAWIVEETPGAYGPRMLEDIAALAASAGHTSIGPIVDTLEEDPPALYLAAVSRALEHIKAGDFYQANLSRRWRARMKPGVRPCDVYRRLRSTNPAPFAASVVLDEFAIVSSSPERLLEVRNGVASTRPIAGTRPRRVDRSDDALRLRELHSHPKERAEHVMLIDLERNDLGRVCGAGTVEVNEFMTLESYAHVHHIVSNVRGRVRPEVTPGQLIRALFPGGTITGCPKVRCMEIIAELEGAPRGAYTGSLGYLNRDGSMDLNILIRTLEMRDGELWFRAGAGIVADSIPERELEETRAKALGLIRALEQP